MLKDRSKEHRFEKIGNSQYRCKYCKCIKTKTTKKGVNFDTYQDVYSKIHTEYLECTGKPDLSEFYN